MFYNRKGDTTCLRSISPFTFLITFEKKLSIMQFLLKLLFAAFFILKLANVQPFNGWSWFLIFTPLAVHWLRVVMVGFWKKFGLDKVFYGEIEQMRYDRLLKKEINRFKKKLNDEN